MAERERLSDRKRIRDALRSALGLLIDFLVWGACYFMLALITDSLGIGVTILLSALASTIIILAVRVLRNLRGASSTDPPPS